MVRRRAARSSSPIESRFPGIVKLENASFAHKQDGVVVVMNRHGVVKVMGEGGRERETFNLTYGSFVKVEDGQDTVEKGAMLAEWDPYAIPILTEVSGVVPTATSSRA